MILLKWVFVLTAQAAAYLIASGKVETCADSGSVLNCTSGRMIVSLSLESGQLAGAERLEAYITTASASGGEAAPLRFPVKIQASKTRATARYPLRYQHDYNNKPRELVQTLSAFECSDEAYTSSPSCGWKRDSTGQKIWDSQGYCCACSVLQTLGLDPDEHVRGNQCQAFNLGEGYATAHCLVLDELWYSAFEIGTEAIGYEVKVEVTVPDLQGNYTLETVVVSPSVPVQQGKDVIVRLIGDFYPTSPPPNLSSLLLFTPSIPADHSRVLMGSRRWMFLNPSQVTSDGAECNKVGTSYTAFNSQSSKCSQQVQSCFQNQPEDLDSADIKRVNSGQRPNYFLSAWGNFSSIVWQEERYLELMLEGRYTTLITVELSADRLVFITSVSTGKIDYAYISPFESQSWDGLLSVQVSSTGAVTAQFSITVNCTQGVAPIATALFPLPAQRTALKTFPVTVDQQTGQTYNCSVVLWDALGDRLDMVTLAFNTSTRHVDLGAQGGNGPDPSGTIVENESKNELSCTDYCPNWFDLPCFFAKGCWSSFLRFLGIIVVILVLIISIKFLVRRYGCCCYKLCKSTSTASPPGPKTPPVSKSPPVPNIPSPTFWSKAQVYYNFHYGLPDLDLQQQFSARGRVHAISSGRYEFHIEDSGLRRLLQMRGKGSEVLLMTADEAYLHITAEPFYPQLPSS